MTAELRKRTAAFIVIVAILFAALVGTVLRDDVVAETHRLALLKELVHLQYPAIQDPHLSDWERITLLRQWATEHIDWGSPSLCTQMTQAQYRRFFPADAPTIFAMFLGDEGAVMCQGASFALMRLYEAYGYESYYFGIALPGVMSHAMTLVRINHNGRSVLTVQDATFDITYVDLDGEPYDYLDMLAVVKAGGHDVVVVQQGPRNLSDILFCSDEEIDVDFGCPGYIPDATPMPALSDGRIKVKGGITADSFWASSGLGAATRDALVADGHPPHLCYVFLYPLYVRDGNGDIRELMDVWQSIVG